MFVTAAHYRAGLKRDAASVWIEDVTQSSFKVCLRELQNYAGSHDDVYAVSVDILFYVPTALIRKSEIFIIYLTLLILVFSIGS